MLFKRIQFSKRIRGGLILVACVTLVLSLVLLFGSAYFVAEEHRHISDVILKQNIQQIDSVLLTADRMTCEFLLENDHINRFYLNSSLSSIDEYKMKLSLDKFFDSLIARYGDAVSFYLFAPQGDRLYLNGALYPYTGTVQSNWIESQQVICDGSHAWHYESEMPLYTGYQRYEHTRVLLKHFDYPVSALSPYGKSEIIITADYLEQFLFSSLPTESSQFYVLDENDVPMLSVGENPDAHLKQILARKDNRFPISSPTAPSIYSMRSEYTGWQYVIRIPKSGVFSLYSPIGLIYSLFIVVYCAGVSIYLFNLLTKPYAFISTLLTQMRQSLGDGTAPLHTDEFMELRTHFSALSRDMDEMRSQMDSYRFAMCNQLILDLLHPERIASYDEHLQQLRKAGLRFHDHCFCAVVLQQMEGQSKRLTAQDVLDAIIPLRNEWIQPLCTQGEDKSILLILTGSAELEARHVQLYTGRMLERIDGQKEYLLCIGVGNICRDLALLPDSYRMANIALRDAMMHQIPGIVDYAYTHSAVEQEVGLQKIQKEVQQVLEVTSEGYPERLERMLHELYDKMGQYSFTRMMVDAVNSELVYRGAEVLARFEIGLDSLHNEFPYGVLFELDQAHSRRACMSILQTYFLLLNHSVMEKKQSAGSSRLSRRIVEYIDTNYTNPDFSASLLETEFNVTSAHISRIFKDYTGMTVQNYLTRLRINHAKELLMMQDHLSQQQIAGMVGYASLQTFMRAFKKETGMSPGVYRQQSAMPGAASPEKED